MDKKIVYILNENMLKSTEARRKILEILLKSKKPISYEQIKSNLSMDKATFYRNMQTFEKHFIVSKFESAHRVWHYELKKSNHAHFICNECENIECIELKKPLEIQSCEVQNITIKGKCKKCLKK